MLDPEADPRALRFRVLELGHTARTIFRNAKERTDRRSLRCGNKGVWEKVGAWVAGRQLLFAANFRLDPPWPDENTTQADEKLRPEVLEAWREEARFVLDDAEVDVGLLEALEEALLTYASEYAALKKAGFGNPKKSIGRAGSKVPAELEVGREDARSADALAEFLITNGLDEYASKLIMNGYDDVDVILAMTDGQVEEMCELCDMLPGHRVKTLGLVQATRESGGRGHGAGAGSEGGSGGGPVFGWPNG